MWTKIRESRQQVEKYIPAFSSVFVIPDTVLVAIVKANPTELAFSIIALRSAEDFNASRTTEKSIYTEKGKI